MASKQPSHTTQTTEVKLPKWVEAASEQNYKFAQKVANKPLEQYQGDTVANPSQATLDAYKMFQDTLGTGVGSFTAADNAYRGMLDLNAGRVTPDQVKAGKFTDVDLNAYMNPYIANVEDKAIGALNDQRIQALMGNADKAAAAGAFGGSRSAIVDAVTNAEAAKAAGLLSADLRKSAFDTAAGLATTDLNRRFSADTANQNANLQGDMANVDARLREAAARQSAAQGLLQTGGAIRDARAQDVQGLLGIGQAQQDQKQREINADISKFEEARDYDLERLNILLSSLGMSPYGKSETTDKVTSGGSSGTDFAQMGLGIFSLLLGLSDRNEKTDIKKVGKDKSTGLDLYAYRYKGDPKTYPKVVGPMAQDVAEKFPEAVHKVGDKLAVNFGLLANV